jgi:hypothetical protein
MAKKSKKETNPGEKSGPNQTPQHPKKGKFTFILANRLFHGFYSISVPRRDSHAFLANLPLMLFFEVIIKSDGHLRNAHISNADI